MRRDCSADYEIEVGTTADFPFDWSGRLDGDTIATSVFELPDGLTEESASNTDTRTVIFISAPTCGLYRIKNTITTAGDRTWVRTIRVLVR